MPAAISIDDELTPVATEARRRTGKRPSPATIWRWCRRGCRGVRLEAVQVLGSWHTTREAFDAFVRGQTAEALATSDDATEERSEETAAKLRAAGVL